MLSLIERELQPAATCGLWGFLFVFAVYTLLKKLLHGWLAERKNSRSGKASLSVLCLFGKVLTTKAAPAWPPPRGTRDECWSKGEQTEIKEKKKCHQDVIGGKAEGATVARK